MGVAPASLGCDGWQWAGVMGWPLVWEFDVVLLPGVSCSSREFRCSVALESVHGSRLPPARPRRELVVRFGGVLTLWRR
jgi:hypothetical protein